MFAGKHFDEGFYLLKTRWYLFDRLASAAHQRCYWQLDDEHMLPVHSLIRCVVGKLLPVEDRGRGNRVPLFALTAGLCGLIAEHAEIQNYDID